MNLFISKCARIINAITACLIITIGSFSAYLILGGNINISLDYLISLFYFEKPKLIFALLTLMITLIFATLLCGIVSILSQIQVNLEEVNRRLSKSNLSDYPSKDKI